MAISSKSAGHPATPPNDAPSNGQAPWSGMVLIALDRRPFAKLLLKWYTGIFIVSYCGLIAWASAQQWSWLDWWLELWTPIVDVLRQIVPVFDNFERALVVKGFGHRVPVIQHLLAFGWIAGLPIFGFLFLTVLNLSETEWKRFTSVVPRHRIALAFVACVISFLCVLVWVVFGYAFTPVIVLFAWQRYNLPLIAIGVMFVAVIMFGIGSQVLLRALLSGDRA
jgi:hypothetical protein